MSSAVRHNTLNDTSLSHKTWCCRCGQVVITLKGEPYLTMNCHCTCCTAVATYVDLKCSPQRRNISAFAPGTKGVAKAMYFLDDVYFERGKDKLVAIKLTDGTNVRSYTSCCNTLVITSGGKQFPANFRPFNRNCIANADGRRYSPSGVVPNVLGSDNMDFGEAPEPKSGGLPMDLLLGKFLPAAVCGCLMPGSGSLVGDPCPGLYTDAADVTEVVPKGQALLDYYSA
eukprot:gnl/TRDRNA2_/TRDRNA2_193193_c0_seq1.p1 gnl/TRDRNA2_/TRDRNA2_193193_c0~~gnl/TRDRNA2_/TRDRNA2_193193_c0_seq1.p1  ORF type:complete len:228 (+),score=19.84 gnl/TRDRNA2_/TRDRNA2_193193_c0_seq1:88-771(+)